MDFKTQNSMLSQITPLILTFNEAPNLRRTLDRLAWARHIVVVDSFSTDETEDIARSFSNVCWSQRRFDSFAEQCNFGLQLSETDWVLSLDADYAVTDELRDEIAALSGTSDTSAYFARFKYCIFGRPLRGTLYPARAILFRKSRCSYVEDGHAHVLVFEGRSRDLRGFVLHDDRKSLDRWFDDQRRYARLEAKKLMDAAGQRRARSSADRLRWWIWPAAPAALGYTLLVKGCFFDGWPGWFYALQRTYAELLLSLELLDRRLRGNHCPPAAAKVDSDCP